MKDMKRLIRGYSRNSRARKIQMVRTRRIELPLPRGNRLLRPARLPVPPRPHVFGRISRILVRDVNFKRLQFSFLPNSAIKLV